MWFKTGYILHTVFFFSILLELNANAVERPDKTYDCFGFSISRCGDDITVTCSLQGSPSEPVTLRRDTPIGNPYFVSAKTGESYRPSTKIGKKAPSGARTAGDFYTAYRGMRYDLAQNHKAYIDYVFKLGHAVRGEYHITRALFTLKNDTIVYVTPKPGEKTVKFGCDNSKLAPRRVVAKSGKLPTLVPISIQKISKEKPLPSWSWAFPPSITKCTSPRGGQSAVCMGIAGQKEGPDHNAKWALCPAIALGKMQYKCPDAQTCSQFFYEGRKLRPKNPKYAQAWNITGDRVPGNPGPSKPATKTCLLDLGAANSYPMKTNWSFNIPVKCAGHSLFMVSGKSLDQVKPGTAIADWVRIDGKKLTANMLVARPKIPLGTLYAALTGDKSEKANALRQRLRDLGIQNFKGLVYTNKSKVRFGFTPVDRDKKRGFVAIFSRSGKRVSLCHKTKKADYISQYVPLEYQIPGVCREAIVMGNMIARSGAIKPMACFVRPDKEYCIEADKCIKGKYNSRGRRLTFSLVGTENAGKRPGSRVSTGTKN